MAARSRIRHEIARLPPSAVLGGMGLTKRAKVV